jgi:type II secretory pathway component PulM
MSAVAGWWRSLARRERGAVTLAALGVLGALYFLGVEEPLRKRHAFVLTQLTAERANLAEIEQLAARARTLTSRAQRTPLALPAGQSPIGFVNASAAEHGLAEATRRTVPQGDNIAVTLTAAPFDALAQWFVTLETAHGITVGRVILNRVAQQPGVVSGSVTLSFAP